MSKYNELRALLSGIYSADITRTYHNWEHIEYTLAAAARLAPHSDIVDIAILYHDVIYVPGSTRNESMSAELLYHHLHPTTGVLRHLRDVSLFSLGMSVAIVGDTTVANHLSPTWKPPTEEGAIVMDSDLASLARPWDEFVQTQDDIWAEHLGMLWYEQEPEAKAADRAKTAQFLQGFLAKPAIYHTTRGHALFENAARENIVRYTGMFGRKD